MKIYPVEKWEKTGLLSGVVGEDKQKKLAVAFEEASAEMTRRSGSIKEGGKHPENNMFLPIVRRLFNHGIVLNSKWLMDDFVKWLPNQPQEQGFYAIDNEINLVENYVNKIVKERNGILSLP